MATFLLTFGILTLIMLGMSLGVLLMGKTIKGSCGGLNGGSCELCSGTGECRRKAKNQR